MALCQGVGKRQAAFDGGVTLHEERKVLGEGSISAISSCVIVTSFEGNRSRLDKIKRHSRCSSEWCRLHTAICPVCAISAWV